MKSILSLGVAAMAIGIASGASAMVVPTHIYYFSAKTTAARGGPAMVAGSGASYQTPGTPEGGMKFLANEGPAVTGAIAQPGQYSIEMFFSLDDVFSYRRLVDFKNGASDNGLYLYGGDLLLFGASGFGEIDAKAKDMLHLVLTRTADRQVSAYANGQLLFSVVDTFDVALFSNDNVARFFIDDNNAAETSSGFVDFIRLYDGALGADEIAALYNGGVPFRDFAIEAPGGVPEPASWATMIIGFGLMGSALRRRRERVEAVAA